MSKVNEKVDSSLEREETLIQKILARVNGKLKSESGNSGLIQETLNRVSANLNSRLTQAKQYVENIFTRVSARLGFGDDNKKDTEEKVHSNVSRLNLLCQIDLALCQTTNVSVGLTNDQRKAENKILLKFNLRLIIFFGSNTFGQELNALNNYVLIWCLILVEIE